MAVWTVISHVWNWLVRFFGSAVMIFTVVSGVLILGERISYSIGRSRAAESKSEKRAEILRDVENMSDAGTDSDADASAEDGKAGDGR